MAAAISTGVPHQASISASSSRTLSMASRAGSSASSGMMAEASQNFTGVHASSLLEPIEAQRLEETGCAAERLAKGGSQLLGRHRASRRQRHYLRAKQRKTMGAKHRLIDTLEPSNLHDTSVTQHGMIYPALPHGG